MFTNNTIGGNRLGMILQYRDRDVKPSNLDVILCVNLSLVMIKFLQFDMCTDVLLVQ